MTPDKNRVRCDRCGRILSSVEIRQTSLGTFCYDCLCLLADEFTIALEDIEEENY